MTLKKFQSFDYHQKLRVVYFQGKELETQFSKFGVLKSFTCYSINRFFVELIFDYRKRKVISIEPFEDGKSLERYTELKFRELLN